MNENSNESKVRVLPLEGFNVVEYGAWHAGPCAGSILGELGAEVIKIEGITGDPERYWSNAMGIDFSMPNGESFMFQISNRNKRGISLDIQKEEGQEIFKKLIKGSDVFITNLLRKTRDKLKITYNDIRRLNPKIIYASVSGYGTEGPDKDLGAFDPLGQARSGMMFLSGNEEPTLLNLAVLDQTTSIAFSHAILTALLHRERRGVGQELDVSLFGTAIWFQYTNMMMNGCMSIGQFPSDRFRSSPLRNCFRCKDGKWIMGVHHDDRHWVLLCEVTDQKELLKDPRFENEKSRSSHYPELIELFDKAFDRKTRDEWLAILQAKGLFFCAVQKLQEVFEDPQALQNGYIVDFDHPLLGKVKIPGYPVKFGAYHPGTRSSAPALGEHTDMVMKQIGLSDEEIKDLRNNRVIR